MKKVIFDNYDSYLDFGLIRTKMEIGEATPKQIGISIEGADGELDLTEYFGDVKYSNRPLAFEFETPKRLEEFEELFSEIQNAIHGKKMKIRTGDNADYYYIGRITVNPWQSNKAIGKIAVSVNAEPYKYKDSPTVLSRAINGTEIITCYNVRKHVIPTIKVTAGATIVFDTYRFNIEAGFNSEIPEIVFVQGENLLTITTNGTVTITYQEGSL